MKFHLYSVCHSMTQLGYWIIELYGHVWAVDYFLMKLHLGSVCHSMTQLGHWVIESRGHVWAGDYFLMNNCKRRKKFIFLYNYTEYYCTTKQSTAVQLYRVKLYNCTEYCCTAVQSTAVQLYIVLMYSCTKVYSS